MRYDESYLKYGITVLKSNEEEKPLCVLFSEVLASTYLNPSKLKRHLKRKHPRSVNRDLDFFKRKNEKLHKPRLDHKGIFFQTSKAGLRASYEVSRKIAVAKKETR